VPRSDPVEDVSWAAEKTHLQPLPRIRLMEICCVAEIGSPSPRVGLLIEWLIAECLALSLKHPESAAL
jgi:hypothetical protein